jgi:hypothetical protein
MIATKSAAKTSPPSSPKLWDKPGALVDLSLTLPVFVAYHLGVIFLDIRNATDLVTGPLLRLAEGSRPVYLTVTALVGFVFAGIFWLFGRGQTFRSNKFAQVIIEGTVLAVVMRILAQQVVGNLFAGPMRESSGPFVGLVMSLGAGFYEELAFRVVLFGLGGKLLVRLLSHQKIGVVAPTLGKLSWRSLAVLAGWAVVCALVFSGVHYVGSLSDSFDASSFTFRFVLGLVLTLIYATRGFATAVWTHALYDVWILVF